MISGNDTPPRPGPAGRRGPSLVKAAVLCAGAALLIAAGVHQSLQPPATAWWLPVPALETGLLLLIGRAAWPAIVAAPMVTAVLTNVLTGVGAVHGIAGSALSGPIHLVLIGVGLTVARAYTVHPAASGRRFLTQRAAIWVAVGAAVGAADQLLPTAGGVPGATLLHAALAGAAGMLILVPPLSGLALRFSYLVDLEARGAGRESDSALGWVTLPPAATTLAIGGFAVLATLKLGAPAAAPWAFGAMLPVVLFGAQTAGSTTTHVVFALAACGALVPAAVPVSAAPAAALSALALILGTSVAAAEERRRIESQVSYSVEHDVLTGVRNRRGLDAAIRRLGAREPVTVLSIEIVDFDALNRDHGRTYGDLVLKRLATRIRRCLRPGDEVGRLGGDAFAAVIAPGRVEVAPREIAERVIEAVRQPIVGHGQTSFIDCRIGISTGPGDQNVLTRAEAAARHVRTDTDGRIAFYDAALHARLERERVLESGLPGAAATGQLRVLYQPVVALAERRLVGAEALIRWAHPRFGLIYPDEFIPLAERSGAVVGLTEWLVRQVVITAAEWRRQLQDTEAGPLKIALNVSAQSLTREDFPQLLLGALARYRCPAGCIAVEVHETLLEHEVDRVAATLRELAEAGVSVSIDDFGTGNVSLSHLERLPLSTLKIDRAFMQDVPFRRRNNQLTSSIVRIAESLGLEVVAEGIETEAQATFVAELGCAYGQGYLFGEAGAKEDILALARAPEAIGFRRIAPRRPPEADA